MASSEYTAPAVRETPTQGYPKPRLLDRVRDAIPARHYSRRTEKAYVAWIKRYIFFHGKRHPADGGHAASDMTRYRRQGRDALLDDTPRLMTILLCGAGRGTV